MERLSGLISHQWADWGVTENRPIFVTPLAQVTFVSASLLLQYTIYRIAPRSLFYAALSLNTLLTVRLFKQRSAFDEGLNEWLRDSAVTGNKAEAVADIREAYQKKSRSLNLCSRDLTALPPQIWRLTWLQNLELSYNKLTAISEECGNLIALQRLCVEGNEDLTDLPKSLESLQALRKLVIGETKIPEERRRAILKLEEPKPETPPSEVDVKSNLSAWVTDLESYCSLDRAQDSGAKRANEAVKCLIGRPEWHNLLNSAEHIDALAEEIRGLSELENSCDEESLEATLALMGLKRTLFMAKWLLPKLALDPI